MGLVGIYALAFTAMNLGFDQIYYLKLVAILAPTIIGLFLI